MADSIYVRDFYPSGKIIFEEGRTAYDMFIIEDGHVEIWKKDGSEKKTIIVLGKGKIFGEMALIDGSARMATAEATQNGATCIRINAQKLEEALSQSPPLIRTLMKALVENLRRVQK